jgi:16S rRNA (cytosine967-C5)-methyltransferase
VAFEVLRAVASEDAYANLVLPARIRHHGLDKRDAGFATELSYGALRGQGTYDAILAHCVDRPLDQLDPAILDALRIGAHQLLAMRVPAHAALDQTVGLARAVIGAGPSALINAVLRKVSARTLEEWLELLLSSETDATTIASIRYAHPEWIVRALRQSLVAHGRPVAEIDELLEADNAAPVVNLVALPGIGSLDEALEGGATPGELVEGSALSSGGDLGRLASVRDGSTRVQDVGSQLVARAMAAVDLAVAVDGGSQPAGQPGSQPGGDSAVDARSGDHAPDGGNAGERWLDLCAGPGGKAALLGALARQRGAHLLANESAPHRAKLVRQALSAVPRDTWEVRTGDGRDLGAEQPESFDRVLVDVPCTGLGALRRRPESRWRRTPKDLVDLGPLQRQLLNSALDAVKPGGVVAYVTCSPHPAETTAVVSDALRKREDLELLDAGAALDSVSLTGHLGAGHELTAQLWPHVHHTDAMFLALIHKKA